MYGHRKTREVFYAEGRCQWPREKIIEARGRPRFDDLLAKVRERANYFLRSKRSTRKIQLV